MKIKNVRITPMRLTLKTPYVWSQGVEDAFTVNLIELEAEDGTIGYGETTTAPDADAQKLVLEKLGHQLVGRSVFEHATFETEAYRGNFLVFGGNMPRYANQLFCGLEMAALDLQGKLLGRPVWDLLGGAKRDSVGYFHFIQGQTIEELVDDARLAAEAGAPIIYVKVGVEEKRDIELVRRVRDAIGDARLQLDANEAWDPAMTLRMLRAFEPHDVEYLEQPTSSTSIAALKQVTERSTIAIGADQSVFTINDVYTACATRAADMIAVGPRELGGLRNLIKAAAICEGAGLKLCIHSSMTTGITTCAEHHGGRAIVNLDDGNQIMWQLLEDNIVESPSLTPVNGRIALDGRPGLGFDLDHDTIARAAERHLTFTREQASP